MIVVKCKVITWVGEWGTYNIRSLRFHDSESDVEIIFISRFLILHLKIGRCDAMAGIL